jgi:hypothetical protein
VFSLMPPAEPDGPWNESDLYNFQGGANDGADPQSGLTLQPNGTFLGTTALGGPAVNPCHYGCGTLFQLTPPAQPGGTWTEQVLYDFQPPDRSTYAPLLAGTGTLYGVADSGGNQNCDLGCGSVYELFPPAQPGGAWSLVPIHQFPGGQQGQYPVGPLVSDTNGVLYGVLQLGGVGGHPDCSDDTTGNCGAVFALTPPVPPGTVWTSRVLHSFHGGTDGAFPSAGLIIGSDGSLYGTTEYGGNNGCGSSCGTVFSLTPPSPPSTSWTEKVIYVFQGGTDGYNPISATSNLLIGPSGVLYGFTSLGGGTGCSGLGCGTLFQLTPPAETGGDWTETVLYAFTGGADGSMPQTAPALSNGALYGYAPGGTGTSCSGGGCGVVYQYVLPQ